MRILLAFITLPSRSLWIHCSFSSDCILIRLSHPDRSKQFLGACLVSSAYQHALASEINTGECSASASLPLFSFSWHLGLCNCIYPVATAWIFSLLAFTYHNAYRSPQLTGASFLLLSPAAACCSDRGTRQGYYTVTKRWRQKSTNKKRLHSTTQRLTV